MILLSTEAKEAFSDTGKAFIDGAMILPGRQPTLVPISNHQASHKHQEDECALGSFGHFTYFRAPPRGCTPINNHAIERQTREVDCIVDPCKLWWYRIIQQSIYSHESSSCYPD